MSLDLTGPRAVAEATLSDTIRIVRAGGESDFDPDTLETDSPDDVEIYNGPCSVVPLRTRSDTGTVGAQIVHQARFQILLPHDTDGIRPGDVGTVTASDDQDLEALELVVSPSASARTHRVLRRVEATAKQAGPPL